MLIVVAAVPLVLVAAQLAYRMAYGTLAWWEDPEQIAWCGRDYVPGQGPLLTRAEVDRLRGSLDGEPPYPVTTVTRVPPVVGRPVLASLTPPATRDRLGVPCAMAVFLQTGPDSYRTYVIVGGP
jgi:hypothetical protein